MPADAASDAAPAPDPDTLVAASHRAGAQVVPRPPTAVAGSPAPWSGLAPSARRTLPLSRVVAALHEGPSPSDGFDEADTRLGAFLAPDLFERRSAVLVALFEDPPGDPVTGVPTSPGAGARVILTVRSTSLRAHRGEVAFPGGRLEPGETVEGAALREACEEVGLDPLTPTVVGRLGSLPTVSSNTLMTPIVATLPSRPTLQRGPDEVDRVFDVALADLLADGVFREEWWSLEGRPGVDGVAGSRFPVWFFEAGGELVWGATARVLTDLLCRTLGLSMPSATPSATPSAMPSRMPPWPPFPDR